MYSPLTFEGAHVNIIFVDPHIMRGVYGCTAISALHPAQLIKTIGAMIARCIIVDNFDWNQCVGDLDGSTHCSTIGIIDKLGDFR